MVIAVAQKHRPVRNNRVKIAPAWPPSRKDIHRPAGSENPGLIRIGVRISLDDREIFLTRVCLRKVALHRLKTTAAGVDMRVLEARQEQPTGKIDDLGRGPDPV